MKSCGLGNLRWRDPTRPHFSSLLQFAETCKTPSLYCSGNSLLRIQVWGAVLRCSCRYFGIGEVPSSHDLICTSCLRLKMQRPGDFKLPQFFNYPPYFTLQPVRETREKQIQLWKQLILDYCRTEKIFVIALEEEFPLFTNPAIERSLNHEAREAFLSALVSEGRAEWLDKGHRKCLILWHRIQDWADIILNFVKDNGLEASVMTVEEIRSGAESRGTELHGIERTILTRALKLLENKGKLAIFKGTSADDEGIKFSV